MPDPQNQQDIISVGRTTFAELVDALAWLIEILELVHYKCEVEDEQQSCYAEQYGDGNREEHTELMGLRALMTRTRSTVSDA